MLVAVGDIHGAPYADELELPSNTTLLYILYCDVRCWSYRRMLYIGITALPEVVLRSRLLLQIGAMNILDYE